MQIGTIPTPSISVALPKVNLGVECKTSIPMQDTQSPREAEMRAFKMDPLAR
jgi:hypothetical protein